MKMLRLLSVAAVACAVGCAPLIKPAGPPIDRPQVEGDYVRARDGALLPLRKWLPAGEPKAVVLGVHGFNDYSFAFEEPGKFLAARGIAVYAYDQRGFGQAPERGYWAGEATLVDDLEDVAAAVARRHPGRPLYLLGESMGGALVMVTMIRPDAPTVAGVVLAAPAVWDRSSMNIFERGALWLLSHTTPWLTVTGRSLNIMPSDNIEMLKQLSRDPLVIKETRVDAIHGLCDLMDDAAAAAPRLEVPALVLYGEHDEVVPAEPTYRMMASLPRSAVPQVVAVYAHGYHMLLRDLDANLVMTDIAAWIADPNQSLPSGADQRALSVLKQQDLESAG
jgi:alpha-beta hydrolase superfamily lysophospholipase